MMVVRSLNRPGSDERRSGHVLMWAVVAITLVAIALGRFVPECVRTRLARETIPVFVTSYLHDGAVVDRVLDPESGRLRGADEPRALSLLATVASPWRTSDGGSEIIGAQAIKARGIWGTSWLKYALVRVAMPGGTVLDRVAYPSEQGVPPDALCWFPARSSRVVFSNVDGELYGCDLDGDSDGTASALADQRVRPLVWDAAEPLAPETRFRDPSRSDDPRLPDTLVILSSTLHREGDDRQVVSMDHGFRWLRLDPTGERVEASGTIAPIESDLESVDGPFLRFPVLGTRPDGRLTLAFLHRLKAEPLWRAETMTIDIDPMSGRFRSAPEGNVLMMEGCLPVAPSFSGDGRWLNVLVGDDQGGSKVARIEID